MSLWSRFVSFFQKPEPIPSPKDAPPGRLVIWAPVRANKRKMRLITYLTSLPYFFGSMLEDPDLQTQLLAAPRDGFLITAPRAENERSTTHRRWLLVFLANDDTIVKVNIHYSRQRLMLVREQEVSMERFIEEQELNLIERPIFLAWSQVIDQMAITPKLPYPFPEGLFNLGVLSQKTLLVGVDRKIPVFEMDCSGMDRAARDDLFDETKKMLNFGSVRIWRLWGVIHEDETLRIILEDIAYGSVLEYVHRSPRSPAQLKKFALQMAEGLRYLEKFDFVHNRLALDCFMMTFASNIKLAIFGLSDRDLVVAEERLDDFERTRWVAPENLSPVILPFDETVPERVSYNTNSMVYTYGSCLYSLFHGGILPFEDEPSENIRDRHWRINNPLVPEPEFTPKQLVEICEKCWSKPKHRPSFKELKQKLRKLQESYHF